jgi:hypothetical protein
LISPHAGGTSILTNSAMLLVATFYTPFAVRLGLRRISKGTVAYAAAAYKLHQLTAGSTNLPQARLLSDGSVPRDVSE